MTEYNKRAKEILKEEILSIENLANNIPKDFSLIVDEILKLEGRVIVIGMGKCSYIAMKLSASLASTGTPSFFVHPAEASHGDLGMITEKDFVIMLSKSGQTKELFDSIKYCKDNKIKIAAINMNPESVLAKNSDYNLIIPETKESSNIGAPTSSALMMLSLCDALVVTLHESKNFTKADFHKFHPGGSLGASLGEG